MKPFKIEPLFKLEITKGINGYVLRYLDQLSDETVRANNIVIEERDLVNNAECTARMLSEVLDYFNANEGIKIEVENND